MPRFGIGKQIDHSIIDLLKPLARKLLIDYDNATPELSADNTTRKPNTLILIELMNWFLEHLDCPNDEKALRGLMKFAIIHYDFDAPFRQWFDILAQEWKRKDWQPMSPEIPYLWKE